MSESIRASMEDSIPPEGRISNGRPAANTAQLPRYPVPTAGEVLERYLEWVAPLVTEEELQAASRSVEEFTALPQLPDLETSIAELGSLDEDSYIFDKWVGAFLVSRVQLVPHTSVPITFEHPSLAGLSQTEVASQLLAAISRVYVDYIATGNGSYSIGRRRFSDDQLAGALGAINDIRATANEYYINAERSTEVLVLHRNRHYFIQTVDSAGRVIATGNLMAAVQRILADDLSPSVPNLNMATGDPDLDVAAGILTAAWADPQNAKLHQRIRDAIFVLCLDDSSAAPDPISQLEAACGQPEYFNRWHGKSTQFMVQADGSTSFIVDHSFCDGGIEARLCMRIAEELEAPEVNASFVVAEPEQVEFSFSSDVAEQLWRSFGRFKESMAAFHAVQVEIPGLSRQLLREHGVLSGDGFFHIAMTAAQVATWGRAHNSYISVDCRTFFRGRTEVMRPVTTEALSFVESLRGGVAPVERQRELLDAALEAHYRRTRQCQAGEGVNRYLYVLEDMVRRVGPSLGLRTLPSLFSDSAFHKIAENRLSCTSFGTPQMKYLYFPPVMDHGFGIFYRMDQDAVAIISAFNGDAEALTTFVASLEEALHHMTTLIHTVPTSHEEKE